MVMVIIIVSHGHEDDNSEWWSVWWWSIFVSLAYPPELDYKHSIETEAFLTTIMDNDNYNIDDDDYMWLKWL